MKPSRYTVLGIDWADVGKNVFGGVHTAGKVLATAFGAGALVAPIEKLEQPALPDWAKALSAAPSTASAGAVTVTSPDYVIVVHSDASKKPEVLPGIDAVVVTGGKRFAGNGYKHGDPVGKTFSFGYDAPTRVDLSAKGKKITAPDVKQVLFCAGQESQTAVAGYGGEMDAKDVAHQILGEMARGELFDDEVIDAMGDYDWRAIFYDPAGELYRTLTPSGTAYQVPQSAQNVYFAQQRAAAAASPLASGAQQRLTASQALQTALRQQQAASTAALLAQARANLPPPGPSGYGAAPALPPAAPSAPTLAVPDPMNPGFLTDGTPDPNYVAPTAITGTERSPRMSNYQKGVDVLGAIAGGGLKRPTLRAGFVTKTAPLTGRKFLALQLNRNAKHNPKMTLATARQVAKRAQQAATKAQSAAKKLAANTKIHGVGAVVRGMRKLTPAQLQGLATELARSAKGMTGTADKYEKTLATNVAKLRAGEKRAQQIVKIHGDDGYQVGSGRFGTHRPAFGTHTPDFGARVVGDDGDFDEATWTEIVGDAESFEVEVMGAAMIGEFVGQQPPPIPDPLNPGFMTDGTPDPSYGGGATASGTAGPPDYGAGPAPTLASVAPVAGLDFAPDPYPNGDDPSFYDCPTDDDLPLGAVVFDGSQQPPFQGLGNYTVFFGMLPGSGPPKGGPNSGYSYHGDDGWWLLLQGTQPSFNYSGGKNYDHVANPDAAMVSESKRNNWGPLMGNPTAGWTKGLRFSPSGPTGARWFWYFDTAMAVAPWAVQAILQARLNEAIVSYQAAVTAGQTDYVNQQIQDQLDAKTAADQARAQAAQDAQLALQQQAQDAQQAAFDQQQAQQQAQQQMQMQQADLEFAQKQAAIDATTDAAAAAYFAQHPELMFSEDQGGAAPADQGAPADEGGGDIEDNVDWGADDRNVVPE